MVCPICGKHIRIICSKDSHMESLSLYELNALVRRSLEQCLPDECWVQAELSDVRTNSTGHCYLEFVQKDPRSNSLIAKARGTIWANVFRLLKPYFEEATGQAFVSGHQSAGSGHCQFPRTLWIQSDGAGHRSHLYVGRYGASS